MTVRIRPDARTRVAPLGAFAAALALALSACTGTATPETTTGATEAASTGAAESTLSGELTVFAAASLHEVFDELAEDFAAEHPDVSITFNYGGSSGLVTQMVDGAPVDVLATANERTMTQAVDEGLMAGDTPIFVTNTLTIVTEAGNPKGITGLADLNGEGVRLVVCAEQVPCGSATVKLEETSGIDLQPASEENAVTDVLGKVTSGQADAGLVYITDAVGAGDQVAIVDVPEAQDILNKYPIGVTANAANPELAQAWVDFILSDHGQTKLQQDYGFGAP